MPQFYKAPTGSLSHTATSNSRWSSLFRRSQGLQSLVERNNTRSEYLRELPYRPSVIMQTAGGNENRCLTFHSTYSIKDAVWVTGNRVSEKQLSLISEQNDVFPWFHAWYYRKLHCTPIHFLEALEMKWATWYKSIYCRKTQCWKNWTHNYHTWLSQQGVRPRPPAAKQRWHLTIANALHVMNQ